MKINYKVFLVVLFLGVAVDLSAQAVEITSLSDFLEVQGIADRDVFYCLTDSGDRRPITWGLDLAWLSEKNVRRGVAFMGKERVDVIRSSFRPTEPVVDGALSGDALARTQERINIINKWLGGNTEVVLNSDHPSIAAWFKDAQGNTIPSRWAEMIEVTVRMHQDVGRRVVTVSPFNEPDLTAVGQGTMQHFYDIAKELRDNYPRFDDIRISGGNTLNTDQAFPWYDFLKDQLDEGNTHQLAGSFDNYASFYEQVRAVGHHATNDELHNVMEAMVGVEYGLQTGIWWGTADYVRSEFVKASDGVRLAYSEHRPNWTAASVYRTPQGAVKAFVGGSERQAVTTSYRYVSTDRPVFYDGQGPQYAFVLELPGAPDPAYYQDLNYHSNAEKVVNITWGDDIQPVVNGVYKLVNKKSELVLQAANPVAGAKISQANFSSEAGQVWSVKPVDPRVGGDFSLYQLLLAANNELSLDLVNFSLEDGANIQLWGAGDEHNKQWYLEYVADGWFLIRSRESSYCLQVSDGRVSQGANIVQGGYSGGDEQLWRFLSVDAPIEFRPPLANSSLQATSRPSSVMLEWVANPELDLSGYSVYRSATAGGPYHTIARGVLTTAFVDNNVREGETYFYVIKAQDHSLNQSNYSNEVTATVPVAPNLVAHYSFDGDLKDHSINLYHAASLGDEIYERGAVGLKSLKMNGRSNFIQLPVGMLDKEELTISVWVKWDGGAAGQQVFDFRGGAEGYMMLTPFDGTDLVFEIYSNGVRARMKAAALNVGEWTNVVVTLGGGFAYLYVNGAPRDIVPGLSITPVELKSVLNYVGRGQGSSSYFQGCLDDLKIFNYPLGISEVEKLADTTGVSEEVLHAERERAGFRVVPNPARRFVQLKGVGSGGVVCIYDVNGRMALRREVVDAGETLDISNLLSGLYMVRFLGDHFHYTDKLLVKDGVRLSE